MAKTFFIQANEKLLIERDYGALGKEAHTANGPMSLELARETVEANDSVDSPVVAVFRVDLNPMELNIENVTEDVMVEIIDHDPDISWDRHVKASCSPSLYI